MKAVDTPEELIEYFLKLDRDKDNRIPNPEFKQFMMNLGGKMTLEDVEAMIKEGDSKGEGVIDVEDFV